jgi:hypothetical protein
MSCWTGSSCRQCLNGLRKMLYRASTILVLVSYVAAQAAMIPQAHHDAYPHSSDVRPHVHLFGHAGAHHHHLHRHHRADAQHGETPGLDSVAVGHERQADAIYVLPPGPATFKTATSRYVDGESLSSMPCLCCDNLISLGRFSGGILDFRDQATSSSGQHCALYLSLLNLRI